MGSESQHIKVENYYFGFLKRRNSESKLGLISKLSQSLKEAETAPKISLQSLFGAYKSDETGEEIIAELRALRVYNRNIVGFLKE
jgi:hypothetical protein